MKVRIYFFRIIVGLMTFTAGLGIYFVWQNFPAPTVSKISPMVSPIASASPVFVSFPPVTQTNNPVNKTVENEETEENFYPDGDYYLIGDLPKAFRDFDYLTVNANKHEAEKDGTSSWKPMVTEGFIFTKTKFKFVRISINNRQISFETEKVNGVSYKFTGVYPKEDFSLNDGEDYIALQGRLTKFKDGKKIATIKAKFGVIECC